MSEGKVLQISPDEAKYIDPTQIASIQMVDGTTILVQGNEGAEEGFVEEAQTDEQQYQTQNAQQGEQPKLRGRGGAALGALAGLAAGTALLGTAAAVGSAMRRPAYGYGYGRPMMAPMMGPPMMRPRPPMMRPRPYGFY